MKKLTLATLPFSLIFWCSRTWRKKTFPKHLTRNWNRRTYSPKAGECKEFQGQGYNESSLTMVSGLAQMHCKLDWNVVTEMDKIAEKGQRWEKGAPDSIPRGQGLGCRRTRDLGEKGNGAMAGIRFSWWKMKEAFGGSGCVYTDNEL